MPSLRQNICTLQARPWLTLLTKTHTHQKSCVSKLLLRSK
jgi:hypothetical protein